MKHRGDAHRRVSAVNPHSLHAALPSPSPPPGSAHRRVRPAGVGVWAVKVVVWEAAQQHGEQHHARRPHVAGGGAVGLAVVLAGGQLRGGPAGGREERRRGEGMGQGRRG